MMDVVFDNNVDSSMSAYLAQVALAGWATVPVCAQKVKPLNVALTVEGVVGDSYLAQLGKLSADWDGYGAAAIGSKIADHAREVFSVFVRRLPAPDIIPTPNGTICFEWENDRGTAQLEIGKSDGSFYLKPRLGDTYYMKAPLSPVAMSSIANLISDQIYGSNFESMSVGNFSFRSTGVGL